MKKDKFEFNNYFCLRKNNNWFYCHISVCRRRTVHAVKVSLKTTIQQTISYFDSFFLSTPRQPILVLTSHFISFSW